MKTDTAKAPAGVSHRTTYRVIYGDTDNMGLAYHANYLRWFEMGRAELFRALGLTYKAVEAKGVLMPVSEAYCKYVSPARYDDLIIIEAAVDGSYKAGVKFDYRIYTDDSTTADKEILLAHGYTRHACLNSDGRVVRPPAFLKAVIAECTTQAV